MINNKIESTNLLLNKLKELTKKSNNLINNNKQNKNNITINKEKINKTKPNEQNKQKNNKHKHKRKYHYRDEYSIKSHPSKHSFRIKDILDTIALLSIDEDEFIEPNNYKEIFKRKDKEKWLKAVNEELNSMKRMNVFTIVDKVPENANIITTRWVLKYKRNSEGVIVKYKARLVARGFDQIYGVDYNNTFSPTLKQDTLRTIVSIAVQNKFNIHQMDIKTAYLNAKLDEEIYMEMPEGMKQKGYCKLNRALYGLKQSGRMWNETLNKVLLKLGFKRFLSDPC
eukprot:jgi/Orpsp1_1/1176144/evm.model.c7180000056545.1